MTDIKGKIFKLIEDKRIDEATALMNEYAEQQIMDDHKALESETKIVESLATSTVADLIKRFPEGFVVSPNGQLFVILAAVSNLHYLSVHYPIPPSHGGYVVVAVPHYEAGDEKFGVGKDVNEDRE